MQQIVVHPPTPFTVYQSQSENETSSISLSNNTNQGGCHCNPVLVADDNEFNLLTFRQIIKTRYNLKSDGAINGKDAVEKYEQSLKCHPY
jgi:PleD family two-component response regulator